MHHLSNGINDTPFSNPTLARISSHSASRDVPGVTGSAREANSCVALVIRGPSLIMLPLPPTLALSG